MKKYFLFTLLFVAAALSLKINAYASTPILSESVAPPTASVQTVRTDGDITVKVTYKADVSDCETVRMIYLEKLLESMTPEELAASPNEWVLHSTAVFCEATADGEKWCTVCSFPADGGSIDISLTDTVLPALKKGGTDISKKCEGFDILLRFITASDNYSPTEKNTVFVATSPSKSFTVTCPELTFIDVAAEYNIEFPVPFREFRLYPNDEPITLPYPSRTGCTFAGWQKWDGSYIESIPEKTHYYRVIPTWLPKTYAINYILSTNISFNFGKADNRKNPISYTYGETTTLHDIKSPIGGYTFDGWFLSRDFSGEKLTQISAEQTGDILLYAKWISDEERDAREKQKNEEYARSLHYGDIDFDGDITSNDARLALRASVGLEKLTPEAARRADIFDTGVLTPANARSILRVSVGLDSLYTILTFYGIILPERKD